MKQSWSYQNKTDEELLKEDEERERLLELKRKQFEAERKEKYHLPLTSRRDRDYSNNPDIQPTNQD